MAAERNIDFEDVRKRLVEVQGHFNLGNTQFGEVTKISNWYRKREGKLGITEYDIRKASVALQVSYNWLAYGDGYMLSDDNVLPPKMPRERYKRFIPIVEETPTKETAQQSRGGKLLEEQKAQIKVLSMQIKEKDTIISMLRDLISTKDMLIESLQAQLRMRPRPDVLV